MAKVYLVSAALSGMLAVILGAFGAHGLRDKIGEELMSAYQTGVQYHFYHTLALLAVAILLARFPLSIWLKSSGALLLLGIALFSGSLYLLALGGPRWLGPITPVGGLCFIGAWICLMIGALKT